MEGTRVTFVVVKAGETLDDLAARYGCTAEELRRLNPGMQGFAQGDVVKVMTRAWDPREPKAGQQFVLGFHAGPMGVSLPGSQNSFHQHAGLLSAIAPYWFDLNLGAAGQIKSRVTPATIRTLIGDAHGRGVKVLASLHNTEKRPGASRTQVLHSAITANRAILIRNILHTVEEYGFDGVNLDFERLKPGDTANYTSFVRELAARLHEQGKLLVVCVLGDAHHQPFSMDFDYPGLATSVDYLGIMTYDEHKANQGTPGPVASIPWVERTVRLAIDTGVPSRKILLGIAAYGYDWTDNRPGARALSFEAVQRLRRQHNATAQFHPSYRVPHFDYTDGRGELHHVWYEDARSLSLKLDLVRRFHLGGILHWRLGLEDPASWGPIRAKLSPIQK
ncbi:LysM peptidoglycan-binding domain-containing protein [Tumebacillus sp. ITR2]|uniref:LysM peptidoglycan-binding domain-containing protein n=2 Tax=Tumebacillus amylolyticus TaxID=2801339 RepID=A0ABS1JEC4_9BACL|nr:LysM peptidoglycan-binding domain-containing protein [Tumebacillus amylolyticus]